MIPLNYRKYGQGPPLIILHGLFGSSDNWHTLAGRWAEFFTVYAIDQRNHGGSPHDSMMSYPDLVRDLKHFMDQQGLAKASILGHSMGGKVALLFASVHPEMVNGVIVLDIGIGQTDGQHTAILEALSKIEPGDYTDRKEIELELKKMIDEPAKRQFLLKNVLRRIDGSLAWRFNRDALLESYDNLTESLDLLDSSMESVLFLRGENSNYLGESLDADILEYFPLAQLETIPNAGHWLHAEQPEIIYKRILDFFNNK